jgi:hypothetical protein
MGVVIAGRDFQRVNDALALLLVHRDEVDPLFRPARIGGRFLAATIFAGEEAANPVSASKFSSTSLNASNPPADAPIPTTGKLRPDFGALR